MQNEPTDDAPAEAGEEQSGENKPLPSQVAFAHPFFHSIEQTSFRTREDTGEAVMITVLDHHDVSLKFSGIKTELNLEDDSPDAKMLDIVAEGLKFVRELRIGDKVPSEMTSGRASWAVTDEHRAIAHNRVTMQLVSWMSGEEMLITDPDQLAQVVDDPKTKEKISQAFSAAAKALNIEEERREDVLALIANLANELSYIEALRDEFHEILRIRKTVQGLEKTYKHEHSVLDTVTPLKRLLKIAIDGFSNSFEQLDAQTGEILSALTNIAQVSRFIRQNRDDLHRRLWAWEGLIEEWRTLSSNRSTKAERLLAELYHFLAQRYLPRDEWELYSKAVDKTKKRSTEVVW
ncbi:hypothetical protein [Magnetovibrio sp.]|uniref:hypothetical protein n=1 Tax=Magnetovibrio sp. TaxID=2024836 RepID=UPI002F92C84B